MLFKAASAFSFRNLLFLILPTPYPIPSLSFSALVLRWNTYMYDYISAEHAGKFGYYSDRGHRYLFISTDKHPNAFSSFLYSSFLLPLCFIPSLSPFLPAFLSPPLLLIIPIITFFCVWSANPFVVLNISYLWVLPSSSLSFHSQQ